MTASVTFGEGRSFSRGGALGLGGDWIVGLKVRLEQASGERAWWSPCIFAGGHRALKDWQSSIGCVADLDYHDTAGERAPWSPPPDLWTTTPPGNLGHVTPRGLRLIAVLGEQAQEMGTYRKAQRGFVQLVQRWIDANPQAAGLRIDVNASTDPAHLFWTPSATVDGETRSAPVVRQPLLRQTAHALEELVELAPKEKPPAPAPPPPRGSSEKRLEAYNEAAIAAAAGRVASSSVGERNNTLNAEAFSLGRTGADEAAARSALVDAGVAAGLSQSESRTAFRSGFRAGRRKPKVPQDRRPPQRPSAADIMRETRESAEPPTPPPAKSWGEPPAEPPKKNGKTNGSATPAPHPNAPPTGWTAVLPRSSKGELRKIDRTLVIALSHQKSPWAGVIAFDERRRMPVFTKKAPTGDEGDVSDVAITNIRLWLERELDWTVAVDRIQRILLAVADRNRFDPVVRYLEALEWDRKTRLDGWLVRNAGAPDSDYVRAVSAAWMISAAARALRPGCKVDHVLVLEGEQGARKSTAFAVLAGEDFFSDSCPALGTKDARQHVHSGPWIVELGELTAIRRADIESVKQFLVERRDRFRWSYARFEVDLPRRSVFCGTTNPTGVGWIRDPTGGRRFWPVPVGAINVRELARERDQLWAEAVHRFREGEPWWLRGPLEEAAQAEQEERLEHDEWEDPINAWLGDRDEVTTGGVLEMLGTRQRGLFEERPALTSWTPTDQARVARILRRLGFSQRRATRGDRRRVWMRSHRSQRGTS